MEEEAQRIAQGQVPEPVPAAVLCKDSTPSSINAIFSPPSNQFDTISPTIPTYNPFEGESPAGGSYIYQEKMETEEATTPFCFNPTHDEPMEGTEAPEMATHDSDSDETAGVGAQAFNPHDAPTPTAEEVDAALAELDSIPDGVCESGEVEEEEEEEEEWSYYRMEPQTQPQSEDVLVPGAPAAATSLEQSEITPEAVGVVQDSDIVCIPEDLHKDHIEQPQEQFKDLEDQSPKHFEEFLKGQLEDFPTDQPEDFPSDQLEDFPTDQFGDLIKDQPDDIIKDQPEDIIQDQPKDIIQDQPEDIIQDQPDDIIQDQPDDIIQDQPEDIIQDQPEDKIKDQPEDKIKDQPEDIIKDQPEDLIKDQSEDLIKDQSEDLIKDQSEDLIKDQPEDLIKDQPEDLIKDQPEDLIKDQPEDLIKDQPEDLIKDQPEDFIKDQPEDFIKDQPEDFIKDQPEDQLKELDSSYLEELSHSQLVDNFQFQPMEQSSPMEADQPPVMDSTPDILQKSMERPQGFEIGSEKMLNMMETSMDKFPDMMNMDPSSPHGSVSPRVPGSPRSVEGFVTSVELNTPEENFGTNFAINQTQDLLAGPVDQPSGPFSVYVSSSPEPASLDPSLQASIDLVNVTGAVTNGQLEEEIKVSQPEDISPVEIVHAQSTVEVVAPPSPIDNKEPEMQFTISDHISDIPTSQMDTDYTQSSEITFVPEPAVEPVAEVPVPVYIEGNTPVSETEMEVNFDYSTVKPKADELISMKDEIHEPAVSVTKLDTVSAATDQTSAPAEFIQSPAEFAPSPSEFAPSPSEFAPSPSEFAQAPPEFTPAIIDLDIENKSWDLVSVEKESISQVNENMNGSKVSAVDTEVINTAVTDLISVDSEISTVPEVAKSTTKTDTKSVKSTPGKTSVKATPGKSTPTRATPGKSTPTRTPSAKTPATKATEKKSPTTKLTPKAAPGRTSIEKSNTAKPASPKPAATRSLTAKPTAAKTTTARPTATKPSAPKSAATKPSAPKPPTAKPTPRSTTSKPLASASTPTKTTEKNSPKPATSTVPRASLSKPSAAPSKPAAARPTPAATRRPVTAPTKTTDKVDSSKEVNGTVRKTAPRPSTTSRTTTSTTSRRLTTSATKTAAEKETKNTTNRILSTSTKSASGTTRSTVSKTSSSAARSITDAKSRVNGTSTTTKARTTTTTKSAAAKTTGVAAKKTMVSKTKTATTGGKISAVKADKTEVIDTIQPVVNGENKIADEETSVEVIEKCVVEDIMQASTEKVFTESSLTMTSSEQVVATASTETTEVIVNGDH
ncbi:flocculation protein FLO11-like isoform X2 [Homarus americanus]|nr:flocculation protein FLO11-like isoform X2 [Homarus americanus]XP_042229742.1 flocculation protein FLO11-like isoform X2 [Homarus americanus]XP_042229743.1 flocculation protein FLO11-like isoform X2 [Homarus americanus]